MCNNNVNRKYLKKCNDETIKLAIKECNSASETIIRLGYNPCERYRIVQFATEHNLSIEHFSRINQRTYSLNENFFENLTEISIYWLGFIMADGNVRSHNYEKSLKIHLAAKDEPHLHNFYKDIGYNGKLMHHPAHEMTAKGKVHQAGPSVTAQVGSKKLINDLIKLECLPNKTKVGCKVSALIPDELFRHFVRGYFDGDGSIVIDVRKGQSKSAQLSLFILGDYNFLDTIRHRISAECNVNLPEISHRQGIDCIKWAGNLQCPKIFDWMYKDAERFLFRKKEKYDLHMKEYISRKLQIQ
jgi:intein-encoded DNA endonuclease-like protein